MHRRIIVIAASVALFSVSSTGATSLKQLPTRVAADSAAVATVVNDFHASLSRGDSAKAVSLLATDAVILESGSVESLSEYRSHHLPEDIKFAKSVASKRWPLRIIVEGSSAWTTATSTTNGQFNGRLINSVGAESMVLTKQGSNWRIRSIHWSSRKKSS